MSGPVLAVSELPNTFTEGNDIPDLYYSFMAPAFGFGTDIGTVSGNIDYLEDFQDNYLFTAPGDAIAELSFTLTSSNENAYLWLDVLTIEGDYPAAAEGTGEITASVVAGLGQQYLLQVYAGEETDYTLSFNAVDRPDLDALLEPFFFQFEGANSLEDAINEPLGLTVDAIRGNRFVWSVGGQDDPADVLKIFSDGSGTATIEARAAGGAANFVLLDGSGTELAAAGTDGDGLAMLQASVDADAEYFLSIEPADEGVAVDVSADIRFPSGAPGYVEDTVDGVSFGDVGYTAPVAPEIDFSSGFAQVTGSAGFESRGEFFRSMDWEDFYRFTAPRDGSVSVYTTGIDHPVPVDLYDASGEFIFGGYFGLGMLELDSFVATAGEEYYVSVYAFPDASAYTLNLEYLEPFDHFPESPRDERIINGAGIQSSGDAGDTAAVAMTLAMNESGERQLRGSVGFTDSGGSLDQRDHYAVIAPADGTLEVDFTTVDDLELTLLDAGANPLLSPSGSAGDDALAIDVEAGEIYFIAVEPEAGAAGDYSLRVALPEARPRLEAPGGLRVPRAGVEFEASGTLSDPTPLALSAAGEAWLEGSIAFGDDSVDIFSFTAMESGDATVMIEAELAEVAVSIIRQSDYVNLAQSSNNFPWKGFANYFGVEAGETYLVNVSGGSNNAVGNLPAAEGPGDYELFVTIPVSDDGLNDSDSVNGVDIGDAPFRFDEENAPVTLSLDVAGDGVISGNLNPGGAGDDYDDDDTYRFTAEADGTARLLVRELSDGVGVDVFNETEGGDYVTNFFAERFDFLEFEVEAGNEYAIQVTNFNAGTDYVVEVDLDRNGLDFVIYDPTPTAGDTLIDAVFLLDDGGVIAAEEGQLYRTYSGALNRTPDDPGFAFWSDLIGSGAVTLQEMVSGFLTSTEFLSYFSTAASPDEITSTDFLNHMYTNVFGREPDIEGFQFWLGVLDDAGATKEEVVVAMTQSNEYVQLTAAGAVEYLANFDPLIG